jgi:hypothetical protein
MNLEKKKAEMTIERLQPEMQSYQFQLQQKEKDTSKLRETLAAMKLEVEAAKKNEKVQEDANAKIEKDMKEREVAHEKLKTKTKLLLS